MDDFVTWLRAHLDEDERVARAVAGSGRWSKYIEGGDDGAAIETDPGGDPGAIIGDDAMAEHMVRHDPARVLAEVAAKRRILEHNTRLHDYADPARNPDQAYVLAAGASDYVLRLLALPYADQPGYDESWRP